MELDQVERSGVYLTGYWKVPGSGERNEASKLVRTLTYTARTIVGCVDQDKGFVKVNSLPSPESREK